jgi:hypothetical protein
MGAYDNWKRTSLLDRSSDQFETTEPVYIDRSGKMIENKLLIKYLQ